MTAFRFLSQPSRTLRRLLIVVAYAVPLFVFGTGRYTSGAFDVWTVLLGVSLVILIGFVSFGCRVLGVGGKQDERQRDLGMQALSVTYVFLMPLAILAGLLYSEGAADGSLFAFCLYALFYLTGFLPWTIVAWLEPDPPPEPARERSAA